jgi:hypothetical protein
LFFTPSQVNLLARLHNFFEDHGVRVTESTRGQLDELTTWVYANW